VKPLAIHPGSSAGVGDCWEALTGKTVDWMEKVSDEQYRAESPMADRPALNL